MDGGSIPSFSNFLFGGASGVLPEKGKERGENRMLAEISRSSDLHKTSKVINQEVILKVHCLKVLFWVIK